MPSRQHPQQQQEAPNTPKDGGNKELELPAGRTSLEISPPTAGATEEKQHARNDQYRNRVTERGVNTLVQWYANNQVLPLQNKKYPICSV